MMSYSFIAMAPRGLACGMRDSVLDEIISCNDGVTEGGGEEVDDNDVIDIVGNVILLTEDEGASSFSLLMTSLCC